jgi:hypothetical protein
MLDLGRIQQHRPAAPHQPARAPYSACKSISCARTSAAQTPAPALRLPQSPQTRQRRSNHQLAAHRPEAAAHASSSSVIGHKPAAATRQLQRVAIYHLVKVRFFQALANNAD